MPSVELNIFQRGILQKCATFFVYMVSAAAGAWVIDWLDKGSFIRLAKEAQRQNLLSTNATRGFTILIEARDSSVILPIMLVGLACGFVGWLFMRWAATRNWSWPTTLPKAVEFRTAMEQLGIADPADRIAFVRKHKLSVFIALSPLMGKEHQAVRAKLYAFAHHASLGDEDVFERHIGKQTLCLDAVEYEFVVEKVKKEEILRESVAIAAQNEEIRGLRMSIASLTQENANISEERDELRGKVGMQPALEGSRVERLRMERLQWAALIPAMERLMKEAPSGKKYTTPELEAAFTAEWERRTDLQTRMREIAEGKEMPPSESLWNAVKAEFKDAGMLSPGGRPKKNP